MRRPRKKRSQSAKVKRPGAPKSAIRDLKIGFRALHVPIFTAAAKSIVAWGEDKNQDGKIDHLWLDINHDGIPEACFVDEDNDGVFEKAYIDLNSDGIVDGFVEDLDKDGKFDCMKYDRDW